MMTLQEIINSIKSLPSEERDSLFDLLRQQGIDNPQLEILVNPHEVIHPSNEGTVERGTIDDASADLLNEKQTKSEGFWDMTLRFRERMQQENITFDDVDFTNLRDIYSIFHSN
ncbi:hypothetical protein G7B40_027565 [Aetokthonos hydrillicola Thurmond2011]|jgi:hypothetical protein|uniref:Uncharacterized protein n=1 Tax=Aetokthonos hydrillicola Thurmond2011 TaxID=2712845 RepID=A0AAP5IFX4_9CYAN|nr:hypothetical protein [Aetokthonos hydrillicola]MBW4584177.1 hypothetical protein [Aetokthonos hydrillicola CCALA 1050]MDR9898290.1 hypothetical protein [Aetokthonos hydrillicola Thurmond2011]